MHKDYHEKSDSNNYNLANFKGRDTEERINLNFPVCHNIWN